jgi:hypothetical protein
MWSSGPSPICSVGTSRCPTTKIFPVVIEDLCGRCSMFQPLPIGSSLTHPATDLFGNQLPCPRPPDHTHLSPVRRRPSVALISDHRHRCNPLRTSSPPVSPLELSRPIRPRTSPNKCVRTLLSRRHGRGGRRLGQPHRWTEMTRQLQQHGQILTTPTVSSHLPQWNPHLHLEKLSPLQSHILLVYRDSDVIWFVTNPRIPGIVANCDFNQCCPRWFF